MEKTKISRREFMASSGLLAGTAILGNLPFEKVSANDFIEEAAAKNIATMICSAVQFFLYFPVDKILFHKKKEEKAE